MHRTPIVESYYTPSSGTHAGQVGRVSAFATNTQTHLNRGFMQDCMRDSDIRGSGVVKRLHPSVDIQLDCKDPLVTGPVVAEFKWIQNQRK